MRFKKSKADAPISSETKTDPKPYQDEPEEWKQLPEEQLIAAWYRSDCENPSGEVSEPPAIEALMEAACSGDRSAQYTLGKMFYNGVSEDVNYFQAASWYSRASAAGSPFADYELAKMCAMGIGLDKAPDQAKSLYENAYRKFISIENRFQNKSAETKLAVICENGLADDADTGTAGYWRRKAEDHPESSPPVAEKLADEISDDMTGQEQEDEEKGPINEAPVPETEAKPSPESFPDMPEGIRDMISLLGNLQAYPGSACAVLDGNQVLAGTIYRIEIYSNTVLISAEIEDIRRPYPVSSIGKSLFVGDRFLDEAEKILKERNGNDE